MIKALLLSSLALNIGLLLGRFSGFLREALVATQFGATAEADTVVLMLTVPDLLVNILMGGALGAVLIPEFTQLPERAKQLLYQAMVLLGTLFLLIASGLYLLSDQLIALLAPGFSTENLLAASQAVGWVIWLIPLTVLSGIVTAYLQANNRFGIAALGTLIINLTIIAGLLISDPEKDVHALWWLALFVLLGGLLRLLSQLAVVGIRWSPVRSSRPLLLNRDIAIRYGQAVLSGSILLFFPVVARAFASFSGEGGVALFNYAIRLVEFPLAIAVTFVAAVFFPRLSQSYVDDTGLHGQLIRYGLQITLVLSVIAAVCLGASHDAYVRAAFDYGGMDERGLETVALLTSVGLLSLPLQGLAGFLTAVFNSRKDTRTPMFINLGGLIAFFIVNQVTLFGDSLEALMWSMLFSYSVIVVLQLFLLRIPEVRWGAILLEWRCVLPLLLSSLFLYMGINEFSSMLAPWPGLIASAAMATVALLLLVVLHGESRTMVLKRLKSR